MDSGIPVVEDSPSHSGGLHIPESKDGFFGYSEEKSLQQVINSTIE
jgi:AMP deaminase